jgi:hypothetical protein
LCSSGETLNFGREPKEIKVFDSEQKFFGCIASDDRVIDKESERFWKEAVVSLSKEYPGICLQEL